MDYLLCFLSFFFFFFHFTRHSAFIELGIYCFSKVFLLCVLPGAAISPWEHIIPFALHLLQRRRPEHFTCFLFIDVIFFNVGLLLLSNCFIICIMNLKLQNAEQRRLCWVYQFCLLLLKPNISTLDKCFWGYGYAWN